MLNSRPENQWNQQCTGALRFELLTLSNDGKILSLYTTAISPIRGFTEPDHLGEELTGKFGAFPERENLEALNKGWIDETTHFETCEYQANWLADASTFLMEKYSWDMLFSEFHGVDHLNHFEAGNLQIADPDYTRLSNPEYDNEKAQESLEALTKMYQISDRWIGKILKQAEENTIVIVASDHGIVPSHTQVNVPFAFKESGLMDYEINRKTGEMKINWSKTKAVQWERNFISVNLKGREPEGIVDPKDYHEVIEDIIAVLRNLKDPRTGESNLFNLVRKEEAEPLGLYGDRIGDIFLTMKPGFTAWPIIKFVRPSRELKTIFDYRLVGAHTFYSPSVLDNRGFFIIPGPGVEEGKTLNRPIRSPDVAPTITHLLGLPLPEGNEGRILYDVLK